MQIPKRLLLTTVLILTACSNMPQDENTGLKAYPNPYNPTAGNLTIERADVIGGMVKVEVHRV